MVSVSVHAYGYVKQDRRGRPDGLAFQAQEPRVRPVSLGFQARKEPLEHQVNCFCRDVVAIFLCVMSFNYQLIQ